METPKDVVQALRKLSVEEWVPREYLSEMFGLSLKHTYRILNNKDRTDPNFDPGTLAKRPRTTRWANSALTPEKVEELRILRTEKWVSNHNLSQRFGVPETIIYDCLNNNSYYDPTYDPSKMLPRDRASGEIRAYGRIYGLTCKCLDCTGLGVQYVGQTTRSLADRLRDHRKPYGQDKYTIRGKWVMSHGPENIEMVELQKDPPEGLDEAEIRWIKDLGTLVPNGKNATPGGYSGSGKPGEENPAAKLTEKQVLEVIERIGTDPTVRTRDLAEKYGVSNIAILNIDSGKSWAKLERPYGYRNMNKRRRGK